MPPQNNTAYDFFMKPEKPKRSSGPTSTKGRVIVVAGFALGLIIIAFIIVGVVSGGSATPNLLKVAQDQTEIIRISGLVGQQNVTTATSQFAVTTNASIGSAQLTLLSFLKANGVKYSQKQLGLGHSAATDQQLSTAASASLYDQTFDSVMKAQLQKYSADLKSAYNDNKGSKLRALLNTDYKGAQILLTDISQPTS
jgi:hypothetical protein